MRLWGLVIGLGLIGCRESAYSRAYLEDSPHGWRRFLQENPRDENVEAAEARLAELEFEAAKQAHSIAAYKRFVEAYSGHAQAVEAEKRLEALRFSAALEKKSPNALRQFLFDHPQGQHREEALVVLAQLEQGAQNDAMSTLVASTMERSNDDAAFSTAHAAQDYFNYLRAFPAGTHRDEARAKLLELQIEALLFSGLVGEAKVLVEKSPLASANSALRDRIGWAEKIDRHIRQHHTAAYRASFRPYVRTAQSLQADLVAADAKARWQAADEFGYVTSIQSVGPLVDTILHAHLFLVRMRAFLALERLFHSLPQRVVEYELSARMDRLVGTVADDRLRLAGAVMYDAFGDVDTSVGEYRKSFDPSTPDPLILWRLAELQKRRGRAFAAVTAAHQMRLACAAQVRHTQALDAANAVAVAREQCSMGEALRTAGEIFEWASHENMEFPDDLKGFIAKSERARRETLARLRDAEVLAQTEDPLFSPCSKDEVAERMSLAKTERFRALDALKRARSAHSRAIAEFILATMW